MRTQCSKLFVSAFLFIILYSLTAAAAIQYGEHDKRMRAPFYFIENKGQLSSNVLYYHSQTSHKTFFTKENITIQIQKPLVQQIDDFTPPRLRSNVQRSSINESFRLIPVNMSEDVSIAGEDLLSGKVNYLTSKHKLNIPTYGRVKYAEVRKNVDLIFYGNQGQVEYDIVVHPGGNPSELRFVLEGVQGIRIDQLGNLVIQLKHGILLQKKPHLYQEKDGAISEINGAFKLLAQNKAAARYEFGFAVGKYDHDQSLIIDPIINYSSYFGGSNNETSANFALAGTRLDSSGNIYITGMTLSDDYPTLNPLQGSLAGDADVYVTKLSPDGSTLLWSTYLGGTGEDNSTGISIDSNDDVWITGMTKSSDFPLQGAYQSTNAGDYDGFLSHISGDGTTLEYSTYLGGSGSEQPTSALFDPTTGNAIVVGATLSANFPTTAGALDTTCGTDGTCNFDAVEGFGWEDLFVTRFNSDGSDIDYSTFIGGSGADYTFSAEVNSAGDVLIHGGTSINAVGVADFPIVNAYQPAFGGGFWENILLSLDIDTNSLLFSSYIGGSGNDFPSEIDVTSNGIVICGRTLSTDFPTQNPLQGSNAGTQDGFVSIFSLDGSSLLYSTYFGGTASDRIREVLIDANDDIWLMGVTNSSDLPLQDAIQGSYAGGPNDMFVSKISADGTTLLFSTYIGGNGDDQPFTLNVDASSAMYLTGLTSSNNFPTANPFQSNNEGGYDAFVVRLTDTYVENFSDGNADGWTFKSGNWTVVPSAIVSAGGGFALSGTVSNKGEAIAPGFILGVGSVEADIQIQTAGAKAFLRAWSSDKKNFVELKILERDKLVLIQRAQGGGLARERAPFTIVPNTTYHFNITYDGQNFEVFVDNNATPLITLPAIADPMGGLSFRLKSGGGSATATITNIVAN